jgi:two-component system nitrogen regulation response regulator GlnG
MSTLLIVDDEPNVLYSLAKRLKSESLEVITASTAKQGIESVKDSNPDAVLLDVRLPDMSGLDAFDEIRQHDPRMPVVIITAHATTETAIEAMKRGAFEYLLKPLDLPESRGLRVSAEAFGSARIA